MERTCRSCGSVAPVEEFPKAGKTKGVQYYRHLCTTCYSKQKTNKSNERMAKFREYKKTLKCNWEAVVMMTTELFSFTIQMIIRRGHLLLSPGIFLGKT